MFSTMMAIDTERRESPQIRENEWTGAQGRRARSSPCRRFFCLGWGTMPSPIRNIRKIGPIRSTKITISCTSRANAGSDDGLGGFSQPKASRACLLPRSRCHLYHPRLPSQKSLHASASIVLTLASSTPTIPSCSHSYLPSSRMPQSSA
jgi:hypothetical protein